jgi:tetratricopeptide (TPR) repeat protein
LDAKADNWDDFRLKSAVDQLVSLSLVKRHVTDEFEGISMHSLAHAWARDRLGEVQQQQAWVTTGCLFALSITDWTAWDIYGKEMRPHIQSYFPPKVEVALSYGPKERILPILLGCGWVFSRLGEYERGRQLLRDIYRVFQLDPSNPLEEYLPVWDLAACRLLNDNKDAEAILLFEFIVRVRQRTLALEKTHPDLIESQEYLGNLYARNGRVNKAVQLLEHAVRIRQTTSAETNRDLLISQHELAAAYKINGQAMEAVQLLEHVLKTEQLTLGENHPRLLISQYELAQAYRTVGQTKKAVDLLEHVETIKRSVSAETDRSLLMTQEALAVAYEADGQTRKALELQEHILKV